MQHFLTIFSFKTLLNLLIDIGVEYIPPSHAVLKILSPTNKEPGNLVTELNRVSVKLCLNSFRCYLFFDNKLWLLK